MTMLRPASEMKDSDIEWIGLIPNDWSTIKNKYLLHRMYSGGTPTASKSEFYTDDGIPFVSISDMSAVNYVEQTKKALTKEGITDKNLVILPSGTILYSIYATVGAVSELKISATISQAILALFVRPVIDKRYYKYNLHAMRDYIIGEANGNTQFNLNANKVWNFTFVLPPKEEQYIIANYLDDRCSKIDEIIAEASASIEEYKELKQAVIFEAVTKGLNKKVPMKDSGIEWMNEIPTHWKVQRIATIYEESKETGRDDLPILLVSIHTGISDREIDDDERDRKVIRSEDKTVYKVVHPNYLAYNMMRAWQGGFGTSSVDGLVSPAYVVAKPKAAVNSAYIESILRTPNAIEHIRGLSYGVADFRLRLYWPYFKNIRVPLPPKEEQDAIVDFIRDQSQKMDSLISEKQALIEDLQAYKKSLIYEVVTGKRRVV